MATCRGAIWASAPSRFTFPDSAADTDGKPAESQAQTRPTQDEPREHGPQGRRERGEFGPCGRGRGGWGQRSWGERGGKRKGRGERGWGGPRGGWNRQGWGGHGPDPRRGKIGLTVVQVEDGSPAQSAGILLGDVLLSIGGAGESLILGLLSV